MIAPRKVGDGDMAFEIVFHEASHTVDDQISRAIDAEASRQQVKVPPDLWHALIFYTTGELAKRALGREKDSEYLPYAYRFNLYGREPWSRLRAALERHWQPYLDGKTEFKQALEDLVREASR